MLWTKPEVLGQVTAQISPCHVRRVLPPRMRTLPNKGYGPQSTWTKFMDSVCGAFKGFRFACENSPHPRAHVDVEGHCRRAAAERGEDFLFHGPIQSRFSREARFHSPSTSFGRYYYIRHNRGFCDCEPRMYGWGIRLRVNRKRPGC